MPVRRGQQLGVLGVLWACACTPARDPPLAVQIRTTGDEPVEAFLATLTFADGGVKSLTCPGPSNEDAAGLRCGKDGFDVLGAERPVAVMLRSRGNAFASTPIDGSHDTLTVHVTPLAAGEETPDYATRLDGAECLQQLEALALPLRSELGDSDSVKFYIRDLTTEPKVYFQNTKRHPLHVDFARNVLGVTGTADDFAQETYAGLERPAMAGTLIFYPAVSGQGRGAGSEIEAPWTLNFSPADTLTNEQGRLAHRLIEERLTCLSWTGPTDRLVYLPATSDRESDAAADEANFVRAGIDWMSRADLLGGLRLQALHEGVAYGTLLRLAPEELRNRPVSFRDILLLTRLPNELPLVGGTITEEFQTPLAHVNVAARGRGTPNLAYPDAFRDPEVASRVGQLVRFEVEHGGFTISDATSEDAQAFWESRAPDRYVPTFDSSTTGILSFADIGFADSVRVGTKAANLAELSHFLGVNAPGAGLVLPFHYYEEFMSSAQTSDELCDAAELACTDDGRDVDVCRRARELCPPGDAPKALSTFVTGLLDTPSFNEDTSLREAALTSLRYYIEHTPIDQELGQLLDDRIAEVFGDAKVKLRSSTNTEDLLDFSGAGLYESHGAYARGEKAASKVVTRVFSSVWSFRAFEERSFWNIDHGAVRMACAINEAFVDELANGVLITQNIADPGTYGMYVNVQRGEASVTNPEHGELPEIFSILADTGYRVVRSRYSSLSPDSPILSDAEIKTLYEAGALAQAHFAKLYGKSIVLDIEFKLTPDHRIVFKQARPYAAQ